MPLNKYKEKSRKCSTIANFELRYGAKQTHRRSFQFGRESAPIAPQIVQTARAERRHRYIIGKGVHVEHRLVRYTELSPTRFKSLFRD